MVVVMWPHRMVGCVDKHNRMILICKIVFYLPVRSRRLVKMSGIVFQVMISAVYSFKDKIVAIHAIFDKVDFESLYIYQAPIKDLPKPPIDPVSKPEFAQLLVIEQQ